MSLQDDALLLALFEVLIPADATRGLPSAALDGMAEEVRGRVTASPGMDALIEASLRCLIDSSTAKDARGFESMTASERVELVRTVEQVQPTGLQVLVFNLFAAYYQRAEVLEALGLPGRAPFPQGFELVGDDDEWFEKAAQRAQRA